MPGLARQAVVLTASRFANYGLMIISPLVLVRFLSVTQFGHYREFILYTTILYSLATFSISDSLLYFIPAHPRSPWRVVRQTAALTAIVSAIVIGGFLILNALLGGHIAGAYPLQTALYVMCYANVDFWEGYWLARNRPTAVFAYSMSRLLLRMLVVIGAAVFSGRVLTIIWALVALEAARLLAAFLIWSLSSRAAHEPHVQNLPREQLRFCMPAGISSICNMVSKNLGGLAVVKYLGPAALAHLTVGTYAEPIVFALRNSISTVVLPELVRRKAASAGLPMVLWHRMIVISCVLLLPAAALVALFARPVILTAFGPAYAAAIPVMQIYALVIARAAFDFAPPLRAVNRTRPLMLAMFAAVAASVLVLVLLLPVAGIVGAAWAIVAANIVEAIYLAWSVKRLHGFTFAQLLPWKAASTVLLCALAAAVPLVLAHARSAGLAGAAAWSALYALLYWALLMGLKVEEAVQLTRRLTRRLRSSLWSLA